MVLFNGCCLVFCGKMVLFNGWQFVSWFVGIISGVCESLSISITAGSFFTRHSATVLWSFWLDWFFARKNEIIFLLWTDFFLFPDFCFVPPFVLSTWVGFFWLAFESLLVLLVFLFVLWFVFVTAVEIWICSPPFKSLPAMAFPGDNSAGCSEIFSRFLVSLIRVPVVAQASSLSGNLDFISAIKLSKCLLYLCAVKGLKKQENEKSWQNNTKRLLLHEKNHEVKKNYWLSVRLISKK